MIYAFSFAQRFGDSLFFLKRAAYSALLLSGSLYANTLTSQNAEKIPQVPAWQSSSHWLFNALTSNFAKQADDYQDAIRSIADVAEQSKQYEAFNYTYDLAISALYIERAAEIARHWVAAYPQDSEAHLALMRALLMKNDVESAYAEMLAVLSTDAGPQNIAQISRLLSYLNDGNNRVSILQRLSKAFPDNPFLYYYLGIHASEQGQIDLAIDAFNHALMIDKQWRQLEIMQAKALSSIGALKEARHMMANLRKRYPEDSSLLSTEIDMLVEYYQWEDALELARRWDKNVPGEPRIQELIAWLYANSKNYAMAEKSYRYLLEHDIIEDSQFAFQMGQAAIAAGKNDAARTWLQSIPADSRLYMLARQQQSLMLFEEKRIAQAQQAFAEMRKEFSDYALEMYLVEITQLDQAKKFAEAQAVLHAALQDYPTQIDLLYAQAEHLSMSGDAAAAESAYQEILALDAANIDALNAYGYLLLTQTERRQEAAVMIEKAIAQYPDSPAIQDSYAWLLYRQGKSQEALKWSQRAYAAYRKNEIAAHYVEILAANDKKDLAREVYQNEMRGQPNNPHLIEIGQRLGLADEH